MSTWKSDLQTLFERIDDWSDDARHRLKRFEGYDEIFIAPYLGFGTSEKLFVRGRVLESSADWTATEHDSVWQNLKNMYRHFETDEVPDARVRVVFQDADTEVISDGEGYFEAELDPVAAPGWGPWHDIRFELLDPVVEDAQKTSTSGQVLIPPDTAKVGIISDIDDTVLKSDVGDKLNMVLTTVLSNAYTRVPFEGVGSFYRALQNGAGGNDGNPVFYVSSSPYNLYGLLVDFFDVQNIPLGPIFLKDFGTHTPFTLDDHRSHKLSSIRRILETYPHLEFVLIGDDGEQDPYIYTQIVAEYPDRIRTIYIRKVSTEARNEAAVAGLANEVQNAGSQLIVVPDSAFAAVHAAGEGLIAADALSDIQQCREKDHRAPNLEDATDDWLF